MDCSGLKKAYWCLVAFLWVLPLVCYAQNVRFERFTMPSGLKVLVHADDRAPVVSVGLAYRTGLNDEPSNLSGINSVVAGMRTESTPHLSPGQYVSTVNAYGGKSAVEVGYDATFFCDSFSSNLLKGAIWLASEKAYSFRPDAQAFAGVLKAAKEASGARMRNPEEREFKALYDMVRTVNLRLVPDVAAMDSSVTLKAAQAYQQLYFNPKNAVLAISGDVDVDSVRRYVVEMFSLLPPDTLKTKGLAPTVFSVQNPASDTVVLAPGKAVDVGHGILAMQGEMKHVDTLYVPQPNESVIFAWQVPPFDDPQFPVFDFIGTVLSSGTGSRLDRVLVTDGEVASSVRTLILPMKRASVFAFKVELRPGVKVSQVEGIIRKELDRMKNFEVTPGELKKAVNAAQMASWQYMSSNEGMVRALARAELLYGDATVFNSGMDKLFGITAEDVRVVFRRFLRSDNQKIIYELPASLAPKDLAKK